jgi:hypothetical protein
VIVRVPSGRGLGQDEAALPVEPVEGAQDPAVVREGGADPNVDGHSRLQIGMLSGVHLAASSPVGSQLDDVTLVVDVVAGDLVPTVGADRLGPVDDDPGTCDIRGPGHRLPAPGGDEILPFSRLGGPTGLLAVFGPVVQTGETLAASEGDLSLALDLGEEPLLSALVVNSLARIEAEIGSRVLPRPLGVLGVYRQPVALATSFLAPTLAGRTEFLTILRPGEGRDRVRVG